MISKRLWMSFFGITCVFLAYSQVNEQDSIARERIQLVQNNMYVLGAWAGANIIQGTISASNTNGSEHFLHQMNAYWNTVNLAIAGVGLLGIRKQLKQQHSLNSNLRAQHKIEKILLFNTGLNLAYIATGFYLKERGIRLNNDRNKGYGNSLLLQGGFLLIFDLIQYGQHHRNTKWLEERQSKLKLGLGGNGLALHYQF